MILPFFLSTHTSAAILALLHSSPHTILAISIKIKADLAWNQLGSCNPVIRKLGRARPKYRTLRAASLCQNPRQRDIAILKGADSEIAHWAISLLQTFKYQTGCIDAVPLAWINTKVFEADFRHVLNRVRGDTRPFVIVKHLQNVNHSAIWASLSDKMVILDHFEGGTCREHRISEEHLQATHCATPLIVCFQALNRFTEPIVDFNE